MKVYKVTPWGCNSCIEKRPEDVAEVLREAEEGETIFINVIEMTEEEYEALPESMGY